MSEARRLQPGPLAGEGPVQRTLHGRRKGRPLRPGQQALIDRLLPALEIDLPAGPVDPARWFRGGTQEVWLEIGFGAGEHLAWQAGANPDIGFIGCEPYVNGVARLLSAVEGGGHRNIRIFRDDARLLLQRLADESIARVFVLFPDPWPKSRHHKRRIVGPATLPHLARILRDGGELRVATDDPGYKGWILQHILGSGAFDWTARRPADWRARPADWPATRYEKKASAANRRSAYFRFVRRPRRG